jgi:hypothetical protein
MMKERKVLGIFSGVIPAVSAFGMGWFVGTEDIFTWMVFFILLLVLFFVGLGSFSIGELANTRGPGLTIVLCVFMSFLGTLVSAGVKKNSDYELALQLVDDLHQHHDEVGFYPENLRDVERPRQLDGFQYSVSTDQQNFSIYYLVDGWHYMHYSSDTHEWTGGD